MAKNEPLDMNEVKRRMDGAIAAFKHDLGGLRTGRASASLLDPITGASIRLVHAAQPGRKRHRA